MFDASGSSPAIQRETLEGINAQEARDVALVGTFPAKDVVWTPAEVEAWREVPTAFITALREGRTLYER